MNGTAERKLTRRRIGQNKVSKTLESNHLQSKYLDHRKLALCSSLKRKVSADTPWGKGLIEAEHLIIRGLILGTSLD